MVKKLIQGLMNKAKKEDTAEKKEEAPAEDVPDELPPLAEDAATETEEKPVEAPAPEATPPAEKPAETVPAGPETQETHEKIELEPKKEDAPAEAKPEPKEDAPKEEVPAEAKPEPKEEVEAKAPPPAPTAPAPTPKEPSTEQAKPSSPGFFANVVNHIKQHGVVKEKLLSGDLFSRMSNYYELRKDEIRGEGSNTTQERLEQELIKELAKLQELEEKWHTQKMAVEEDIKFLHEREKDIQLKTQELKGLTNTIKLYKDTDPNHYFILQNGVVIKNLHELIDALEVMDEDTFKHHAHADRNDFASWVREVIKDTRLADKLQRAGARYEMITLLETEPIHDQHSKRLHHKSLNPHNYFWLANGSVVKNLQDLSDALRFLDEETFRKHVNDRKNDFSRWIMHAFKNRYLAEKLKEAKTKEDMIELLEVFL